MKFTVTTEGPDRLGLVSLCQQFADAQWLPAHLSPDESAAMLLDQFRRTVLAELEMLDVKVER